MTQNAGPSVSPRPLTDAAPVQASLLPLRKIALRLRRGQSRYDLTHDLATEDVLVQTRIAGRVREGGIVILDQSTVRIEFGGPLHEDMDVVIIG